ncbi:nuclear transport factor 2 family protein [Rhizobium leguminosarum]|uniref:nuclear transport factor 2 family protein n=1 Tax=Rhizobium leguminosarum TaxID=384 RepID=UPI001FEFACF1|nr:nuclear transport factor 2 family protein [Rhizobium leguminosarum]
MESESNTLSSGQLGSSFKGRKEIGDAFAGYLANFETVYHINGQQTVELNGDTATGTAYCLVVLIADEAGKKIKNTSGVTYHDEYVRRDGKWLIAKRTSNFVWRDRQEPVNSTASANSACPGSPRRHPPRSCRPAVAAIRSEYSLLERIPEIAARILASVRAIRATSELSLTSSTLATKFCPHSTRFNADKLGELQPLSQQRLFFSESRRKRLRSRRAMRTLVGHANVVPSASTYRAR